jgi:hypothetical protein
MHIYIIEQLFPRPDQEIMRCETYVAVATKLNIGTMKEQIFL